MKMAQAISLTYMGMLYWSPVSLSRLTLECHYLQGFAANARITQAKIKLEETHNNIEAMKLNIDREIQTSITI